MKLEFEITYDDCLAGMLETIKRQRTYESWSFFWRWGMASAALVLTVWALWKELGMATFLVGLGLGTLVRQLMPWILERRMITMIHGRLADPDARAAALGKRTLELLPEGMKLAGPQYEVVYKWSVLESIERRGSRVFVFLKGLAGIAIPASAVDADAFIARAQGMREGGQAGE